MKTTAIYDSEFIKNNGEYADLNSSDSPYIKRSIDDAQENTILLDNISNKYRFQDEIEMSFSILRKYEHIIKALTTRIELNRDYWYKPEYLSYYYYGTTDLWYLIMFVNNMKDPLEFCTETVLVVDVVYIEYFMSIIKNEDKMLETHDNPRIIYKHILKDLNTASEQVLSSDFNESLEDLTNYKEYTEITNDFLNKKNFTEKNLHILKGILNAKMNLIIDDKTYLYKTFKNSSFSKMEKYENGLNEYIAKLNSNNGTYYSKEDIQQIEINKQGYLKVYYTGVYRFKALTKSNFSAYINNLNVINFQADENSINSKYIKNIFEEYSLNSDFKRRNLDDWNTNFKLTYDNYLNKNLLMCKSTAGVLKLQELFNVEIPIENYAEIFENEGDFLYDLEYYLPKGIRNHKIILKAEFILNNNEILNYSSESIDFVYTCDAYTLNEESLIIPKSNKLANNNIKKIKLYAYLNTESQYADVVTNININKIKFYTYELPTFDIKLNKDVIYDFKSLLIKDYNVSDIFSLQYFYLGEERKELYKVVDRDELPKIEYMDKLCETVSAVELPKIEKINKLMSVQKTDELAKVKIVDKLPEIDVLDELPIISKLEKIPNIEHVDNLPYLEEMDKLPNIKKVNSMPDVEKIDNLYDIIAVKKLPSFTVIENESLPKITKTDILPTIWFTDNLPSLKSQAIGVAELPKVHIVSSLPIIEVLKELPNVNKVNILPKVIHINALYKVEVVNSITSNMNDSTVIYKYNDNLYIYDSYDKAFVIYEKDTLFLFESKLYYINGENKLVEYVSLTYKDEKFYKYSETLKQWSSYIYYCNVNSKFYEYNSSRGWLLWADSSDKYYCNQQYYTYNTETYEMEFWTGYNDIYKTLNTDLTYDYYQYNTNKNKWENCINRIYLCNGKFYNYNVDDDSWDEDENDYTGVYLYNNKFYQINIFDGTWNVWSPDENLYLFSGKIYTYDILNSSYEECNKYYYYNGNFYKFIVTSTIKTTTTRIISTDNTTTTESGIEVDLNELISDPNNDVKKESIVNGVRTITTNVSEGQTIVTIVEEVKVYDGGYLELDDEFDINIYLYKNKFYVFDIEDLTWKLYTNEDITYYYDRIFYKFDTNKVVWDEIDGELYSNIYRVNDKYYKYDKLNTYTWVELKNDYSEIYYYEDNFYSFDINTLEVTKINERFDHTYYILGEYYTYNLEENTWNVLDVTYTNYYYYDGDIYELNTNTFLWDKIKYDVFMCDDKFYYYNEEEYFLEEFDMSNILYIYQGKLYRYIDLQWNEYNRVYYVENSYWKFDLEELKYIPYDKIYFVNNKYYYYNIDLEEFEEFEVNKIFIYAGDSYQYNEDEKIFEEYNQIVRYNTYYYTYDIVDCKWSYVEKLVVYLDNISYTYNEETNEYEVNDIIYNKIPYGWFYSECNENTVLYENVKLSIYDENDNMIDQLYLPEININETFEFFNLLLNKKYKFSFRFKTDIFKQKYFVVTKNKNEIETYLYRSSNSNYRSPIIIGKSNIQDVSSAYSPVKYSYLQFDVVNEKGINKISYNIYNTNDTSITGVVSGGLERLYEYDLLEMENLIYEHSTSYQYDLSKGSFSTYNKTLNLYSKYQITSNETLPNDWILNISFTNLNSNRSLDGLFGIILDYQDDGSYYLLNFNLGNEECYQTGIYKINPLNNKIKLVKQNRFFSFNHDYFKLNLSVLPTDIEGYNNVSFFNLKDEKISQIKIIKRGRYIILCKNGERKSFLLGIDNKKSYYINGKLGFMSLISDNVKIKMRLWK